MLSYRTFDDAKNSSTKNHINQSIVFLSIMTFLFMISLVIPADSYMDGFMAWEDAMVYFNRNNNLDEGFEFYKYGGYVSFVPEVVTYIFSFLPYLIQALCYALTALLLGLWMFYQLVAILVDAGIRPRLAYAVALATVGYLHIVAITYYLNLTFAIWPALIGASIYVVRIALVGAKLHWLATILAAASFASHPLAIASLPVIGVGLYVRREQLRTFIPHAIALVLGILFVSTFTDASRNMASGQVILEILWRYLTDLFQFDARHVVTNTLPVFIIVVAIVVGLAKLPGLAGSGSMRAATILAASLLLVVVYVALFLASGRLAVFGHIPGRYFSPMIVFAIVALTVSFARAPWLSTLEQGLERLGRAPVHGFLAVWLIVSAALGPAIFWNHYANRLQFLSAAQCVRDNGPAGIAIAAEDHEYTLTIKKGLGTFDRPSTVLHIAALEPSSEPLAELQRICPGIRPSYLEDTSISRIWIGTKAF